MMKRILFAVVVLMILCLSGCRTVIIVEPVTTSPVVSSVRYQETANETEFEAIVSSEETTVLKNTTAAQEIIATQTETESPATDLCCEPDLLVTEKEIILPVETTLPEQKTVTLPIHYEDDGVMIDVYKTWYINTYCYVAHITMRNFGRLRTAFSDYGYGKTETVKSFADRNDFLFAVNGDYSEGLTKSVLRNGLLYGSGNDSVQCAYSQYNGTLLDGNGASLTELVQAGFTDSFDFGASPLVVEGKSIYLRKDGGKSTQRTLIGSTQTPGEIYVVVTEGRYSDGESKGLQYWESGDFLESLGCYYGVALDGGGSSAMVWDGVTLTKSEGRPSTGFLFVSRY